MYHAEIKDKEIGVFRGSKKNPLSQSLMSWRVGYLSRESRRAENQ
jgi:hypothetical protein